MSLQPPLDVIAENSNASFSNSDPRSAKRSPSAKGNIRFACGKRAGRKLLAVAAATLLQAQTVFCGIPEACHSIKVIEMMRPVIYNDDYDLFRGAGGEDSGIADELTATGFLERCVEEMSGNTDRTCLLASHNIINNPSPDLVIHCPVVIAMGAIFATANSVSSDVTDCSFTIVSALVHTRDWHQGRRLDSPDLDELDLRYLYTARDVVSQKRMRCASLRQQQLLQLKEQLPPPMSPVEKYSRLGRPPRIGILLAGNEEMLERYQPYINLWRCYALRHGFEFIIDTNVRHLQDHYRALNWARWTSAQRNLKFYDWLVIVDPDMFVAPSCWSRSIMEVLDDVLQGTSVDEVHLVTREVHDGQTMNNGVTIIRNSEIGHLFLQMHLEKMSYMQIFMFDQGSFDETVEDYEINNIEIVYNLIVFNYTLNFVQGVRDASDRK